jgi:hypothetical protein
VHSLQSQKHSSFDLLHNQVRYSLIMQISCLVGDTPLGRNEDCTLRAYNGYASNMHTALHSILCHQPFDGMVQITMSTPALQGVDAWHLSVFLQKRHDSEIRLELTSLFKAVAHPSGKLAPVGEFIVPNTYESITVHFDLRSPVWELPTPRRG